ncbi:MAG: DUF3048 C-terminal domain-containing protein, partial [Firmicutes bacterium]|nr:DUF3048 C-terminal domain-containing protein [Bacillota bacterium]
GVGTIGTVRSARPYYLETALGYDAIYIHAGGSEDAYSKLSAWKMDHMDGVRGGSDANIFWRDAWRKANNGYEHSLVTSAEKILEYMSTSSMRKTHAEGFDTGLRFGETAATANGEAAAKVTVRISNYKTGIFEYNEESKKYKVSQYGSPMMDGDADCQLESKNVLVLNTTSKVVDDYGRMSYVTTGENTGTYFCEGKSIPIKWSRADRNDVFRYTAEDGKELELMPGNTYIVMLNASGKLTVE